MKRVYLILLILFVMVFMSGCFSKKTEIVLIGTLRDSHYLSHNYSMSQLKEILNGIQPDIICIDMTPKHYINKDMRFMQPEVLGVIDPWAKQHDVPVYGIGWWDENFYVMYQKYMKENHQKYDSLSNALKNTDEYKRYENILDDVVSVSYKDVHADTTLRTIENYYKKMEEIYQDEEPTLWWEKRNAEMLKRLLNIANKNKGKRIAVVVGMDHIYYLYKRLQNEKNITVHLCTYYDKNIKKVGKDTTSVAAAIRLRTLLEAPIVDTFPEGVDTVGLREDTDILFKDDSSMAIYYKGVLSYLNGDIKTADSLINKAANDTTAYLTKYISLSSAAYLKLAKIYDYLGNRKKAIYYYKKALVIPYKTGDMLSQCQYGISNRLIKPSSKSKLWKKIKEVDK